MPVGKSQWDRCQWRHHLERTRGSSDAYANRRHPIENHHSGSAPARDRTHHARELCNAHDGYDRHGAADQRRGFAGTAATGRTAFGDAVHQANRMRLAATSTPSPSSTSDRFTAAGTAITDTTQVGNRAHERAARLLPAHPTRRVTRRRRRQSQDPAEHLRSVQGRRTGL